MTCVSPNTNPAASTTLTPRCRPVSTHSHLYPEAVLRVLPIRYSEILSSPDLIQEYAAECANHVIGKPDPQPETYEQLENSGLMRCFGLYRVGRLIGFASILLAPLPHYGLKVGIVESLFVSVCERGLASGKLLLNIEAYARASECVSIICSAPVGGAFEAFLRGRDDCQQTNSVFCWRLT